MWPSFRRRPPEERLVTAYRESPVFVHSSMVDERPVDESYHDGNTGLMKTSTMTVKGQVTVPKEFRDALGWRVGEELAFLREKDGVRLVRAPRQARGRGMVERLKEAPWNRKLTTDTLMALTRGGRK